MAHPDMPTVAVDIPNSMTQGDWEELQEAMNAWQDAQTFYIISEAKRLGIGEGYMADIYYLRTRSRWTQEKEDYLIGLAKEHKEFPNIMAGDF